MRALALGAALSALLEATGCTSLASRDLATVLVSDAAERPAGFLGLPLASGQIVVSESGGALSLFVTLAAEEFSPFVHAGVLALEGGEPWVYEAVGTLWPSFGQPPTAAIGGAVRRVSLASLIQRQQFVAIFDPAEGVDAARVAAWARAQYEAGTRFDPYFDPEDDRFYCTEFVAAALAAGGAPPVATTRLRRNPSLEVVLAWLRVRAREIVLAKDLVADARPVATLSLHRTPAQAALYFALKRELHARFTDDQKLGNVFLWDGLSAALRDGVEHYLKRGLGLFEGPEPPDEATARAAASALARQMFGPAEGERGAGASASMAAP